MKKLLKYLGSYKKESVLGPLFKLLEASFELLIPLVVASIVDDGIRNGDMHYILKMGAVMVALGVIGLVCALTAQYFAAKAAVGFATKLRHDLFKHIQSLSYTEMDEIGTSTLITRMTSDVNQVQSGVNLVLRLFLRSPFIVFGAMVMAFTVNVDAAWTFVVTIPALSVVVFGIMMSSIPMYKKVQARLDRVLLIARENLTGVRVIRAFNKQEDEKASFEDANQLLVKQQVFVGKVSALMNPLTYVIVNGAMLVLIWKGAWQVENGIITQGEVMALVNYMSQILVELVKLANLIITVTKALACANRISSLFDIETSIKEMDDIDKEVSDKEVLYKGVLDKEVSNKEAFHKEASRKEGMMHGGDDTFIEFEHVCFAYAGSPEEALTDINLKVKKGQTIGIIGGTGSGKSTLVNLIPRFYDITSGQLRIDGLSAAEYKLETLRKKVGVVPQKAVLFKGTIEDNLRWGKKDATSAEMMEALEASQALEFVASKAEGMKTVISQGGKNLSGGQRQRLTIARALVRKPEILILDDSASALDYATDAKLRSAIAKLDEKMTVFIVSQRAASIWHSDQIVVLDDGEVAGIGTHDELLEKCSVYQEIYYSQFPKEGAER